VTYEPPDFKATVRRMKYSGHPTFNTETLLEPGTTISLGSNSATYLNLAKLRVGAGRLVIIGQFEVNGSVRELAVEYHNGAYSLVADFGGEEVTEACVTTGNFYAAVINGNSGAITRSATGKTVVLDNIADAGYRRGDDTVKQRLTYGLACDQSSKAVYYLAPNETASFYRYQDGDAGATQLYAGSNIAGFPVNNISSLQASKGGRIMFLMHVKPPNGARGKTGVFEFTDNALVTVAIEGVDFNYPRSGSPLELALTSNENALLTRQYDAWQIVKGGK
jgi:hypothetical protein